MTARAVLLPLCLLAGCASTPTPAQRSTVYQANIELAQATCMAMLMDKEVTHTQAADEWCVLVLQGKDGCVE